MLRFQPMITSRMRRFIACLGGVRAKSINNRKKIPVCERQKTNFYEINIPILSKTKIKKIFVNELLPYIYIPVLIYTIQSCRTILILMPSCSCSCLSDLRCRGCSSMLPRRPPTRRLLYDRPRLIIRHSLIQKINYSSTVRCAV